MMNELHLFAGAGGGILAGKLLGHRTIGAVEINPYRQDVLCARQDDETLPPFPIFTDIKEFDATPFNNHAQIVAGGFPCQAFSSAARGRNNAEDLWPEMRRVIKEVEPAFVFAENVKKAPIECAARDLINMGYRCRAMPLSAKDVGADHIRNRFWILGYSDRNSQPGCTLHDEVARMSKLRPGVWQSKPRGLRVAHGPSKRVDRCGAAGDAQIPIVAVFAYQHLILALTNS